MDIALLKTFLAVSDTGSFAAASDRLHVTQSAVSLRVQRLEELLGHELFVRSKTGTEPTPSGREFTSYALTLLRTWEQARQQIATTDTGHQSLVLGGQISLWPRLGFRWLSRLMAERPNLVIRAEHGQAESLSQAMETGGMQICLTYSPVARPGLRVEKVMEDELVLVAPWPNPKPDQLPGRYALIDWGPEFQAFHDATLPGLHEAALTLGMGAASAPFLITSNLAAFLPARIAKPLIDTGALHVVEQSQSFRHVAWSVWREDLDEHLADVARRTLFAAVEQAVLDTTEVADQAHGDRYNYPFSLANAAVNASRWQS